MTELAEFPVRCGGIKRWTRLRVLLAVRAWVDEYGSPPSADMWRQGRPVHPVPSTCIRIFGSWANMIEAAGYPRPPVGQAPTFTRETAILALQEWVARTGRMPGTRDWACAEYGRPCTEVVRRLFGSWNAGLEAAGFSPVRPWTRERIVELMLDWTFKHNRWPTQGEWDDPAARQLGVPTANTVARIFGSWVAAKRYAGWRTKEEIKAADRRRAYNREHMRNARRARRQAIALRRTGVPALEPPAARTAAKQHVAGGGSLCTAQSDRPTPLRGGRTPSVKGRVAA